MGRQVGTQKTGGRRKGTPNRKTLDLERRLYDLNFDVPKHLLEPSKRADVLVDLVNFLYPKRKAVERTEIVEDASSKRMSAIAAMTPEERKLRL